MKTQLWCLSTFLSTQSRYSVSWWLVQRLFNFCICLTVTFLQTLNYREGIVIVTTIYFQISVQIFDLGKPETKRLGFIKCLYIRIVFLRISHWPYFDQVYTNHESIYKCKNSFWKSTPILIKNTNKSVSIFIESTGFKNCLYLWKKIGIQVLYGLVDFDCCFCQTHRLQAKSISDFHLVITTSRPNRFFCSLFFYVHKKVALAFFTLLCP